MDNGCNVALCLLLVRLGVCLACNSSKTELHLQFSANVPLAELQRVRLLRLGV